MIEKIARLLRKGAAILILRGDDSLTRFLSDFLENLVQPLVEKVSRIRTLWSFALSLLYESVKRAEHFAQISGNLLSLSRSMNGIVEAGRLAGVTSRPRRLNSHDERIAVAIQQHIGDALSVAGSLALVPKLRSRTRPEPRLPSLQRSIQALSIHVSQHQYAARVSVLHNGGHQTALIELHVVNCHFHLTTNPRARKNSFTSAILYCPK